MNKTVAIVLDSSIYKQIPKLNSELMAELVKYCRLGRFKIFIPEIVEQEYLTWIEKEIREALDTIIRTSKSLTRFDEPLSILGYPIHYDVTSDIATSHAGKVLNEALERWRKFKEEVGATVAPIKETHGKLVMHSYFSGDKPFKSVKNRNDIPDAFIYFSLLDLLKKEGDLVFVSADKGFTARIEDKRIRTFEKLTELFSNTDFRIDGSFFTDLEPSDKWFHLFQYFKEEILRKGRHSVNMADLIYDIENDYRDDIIGYFRETYSDVTDVTINQMEVRAFHPNTYLVPFVARVEVTVSSFATPEEFKSVEPKRRKAIEDSEINDSGKYEIKEVYATSVRGNLSVSFAETDPLSWMRKIDKDSILREEGIEEISVRLEDVERCT